jgi:hypothetical protein
MGFVLVADLSVALGRAVGAGVGVAADADAFGAEVGDAADGEWFTTAGRA